MFAALAVHHQADNAQVDELELVASDAPVDCAKITAGRYDGRLVVHAILHDWSTGVHPADLSVTSDASTARFRWHLVSDRIPVSAGHQLLWVESTQLSAPTRRGDRAHFVVPEIAFATLPPIDPASCCAASETPSGCDECPLPTRIDRIGGELEVELCDDVDPYKLQPRN
jgi:hypothetical protein